ncbi:hypothetical protein AU468_12925 [Alkalispirochaeta sphaeroplastigenens]|uniref:DNA 3'-5' helicase n=1 Tax=Alkalispirochaeta sphaeroplastigenens TaxID=1187066 RepID=A0A2S4JG74_9SPIO|nr:RecQ family ATP-dependent DNA helicase [Alkalispirochaeta sphaeroplastigenens]POQ98489.1 hypothetical protein AU468_12925 [Alkalispirochaeta sphaeroplastigenens]
MEDPILDIARNRFGLDFLFPYQRLVISNILEAAAAGSEDALALGQQIVILPTGAGKSLCFQLPAATLPGITLVIYPLLSLMNDQARRMTSGGFSVVQLRGGQSGREREKALTRISRGDADFVITNPETLQNERIQQNLKRARVVHAVIDEAHCVSEWGDSFRPVYLTLGETLNRLEVPLVTAFTATAGDKVLARIRECVFPRGEARLIRGNPDRENISYRVQPCLSLAHGLRSIFSLATPDDVRSLWKPGQNLALPAIVFCRTRRETRLYAALVASVLGEDQVIWYHAGLDTSEKEAREHRFFESSRAVLCATCAYGMGVDKGNIRSVIHTYLPDSVEAFLQESGRAGRDRERAQSILLADPRAEAEYRRDRATGAASLVQHMAFGTTCRREPLLEAMGTVSQGACSGCDRCEEEEAPPAVATHPSTAETPAARAVLGAVASRPGQFTVSEWVRILRGRASWQERCRGTPRISRFGALRHWSDHEVSQALEGLTLLKALRLQRDQRLAPPATSLFPGRAPLSGEDLGTDHSSPGIRQKGSPPTIPEAEKSASLIAAAASMKVRG